MYFDVDVRLRRGERVIACSFASEARATVLVGPSGTGKTSVLHAVAGLVRPEAGHVRVAAETLFEAGCIDVAVARRRAGYVFQDTRLFPHLSVRHNLLYGAADADALQEVAAMLDVTDLLDRRPATLSGGEVRRVAIGRALLMQPRFLLLDEPTVSLDRARREEVRRAVARARDAAGVPVLMVTHDEAEAARIGAVVRMGEA